MVNLLVPAFWRRSRDADLNFDQKSTEVCSFATLGCDLSFIVSRHLKFVGHENTINIIDMFCQITWNYSCINTVNAIDHRHIQIISSLYEDNGI